MKRQPISNIIDVYIFPTYAPEIYSDLKGKFFTMENDTPLKIVYNNGTRAIRLQPKIFSLNKLRKCAVKSKKELMKLPF